MKAERYDFETLDDLLAPDMSLVLVGINPSTLSVARGHYFARKTNRFWPAFSRSRLSASARAGLGLEVLSASNDVDMTRFGIGFTDVVKVPSPMANTVGPADYQLWTPRLVARLRRYAPSVACFHGLTAWRPFVKWGLGQDPRQCKLGAQSHVLGSTRVFVVPNPSPANAHFTPDEQVAWYDALADFIEAPP